MPNLVNKKCVKCFYCGGKAYSYAMMNYKGFKFNGHPSCKQKWMKNVDAIKQSDALGTVRGKRKGTYIEAGTELPFTPDKVEEDAVSQADLEALAEMKSIANGDLQPVINRLVQANDELFRENQALRETVRVLLA